LDLQVPMLLKGLPEQALIRLAQASPILSLAVTKVVHHPTHHRVYPVAAAAVALVVALVGVHTNVIQV
jgi:hypothetical protein